MKLSRALLSGFVPLVVLLVFLACSEPPPNRGMIGDRKISPRGDIWYEVTAFSFTSGEFRIVCPEAAIVTRYEYEIAYKIDLCAGSMLDVAVAEQKLAEHR